MFRKSFTFTVLLISFLSCTDDENNNSITVPVNYSFERNGSSTVDFTGQTNRIQMAEELNSALLGFTVSTSELMEMFSNQTAEGGDANPFSSSILNNSEVSIRSKVAASTDYFSTNSATSSVIKTDFETWIAGQADEVFQNSQVLATPGVAGQLADGSSVRYVNAKGLEYDQAIVKGLIGSLMVDQALNNYLSTSILDENDNRANNNAKINEDGKPYTSMEHKWDEAFGYFYGNAPNPANANTTVGQDDNFVNKYIGRLYQDEDFATMPDEIFDAFKLGRAAIVANDYALRDAQADIIRELISEIIGIRVVYYMIQGKLTLPENRTAYNLYGPALHDLSEGYGFIYSLQFTRKPGTNQPYFSKEEVDAMLIDLTNDGENGLWDVQAETLDAIAQQVADAFNFTVEQAGS